MNISYIELGFDNEKTMKSLFLSYVKNSIFFLICRLRDKYGFLSINENIKYCSSSILECILFKKRFNFMSLRSLDIT